MKLRAAASFILVAALLGGAPAYANGGVGGSGMRSASTSNIPDGTEGASPEEINKAYDVGVAAVAALDWRKAVSKFAFVTDNAPELANGWNMLGYSSRKAGNAKRSESAYKRALKIEPNHPGANEYYGELLLELNRIPEAEQRLSVLQACCAANPVTAQLAGLIADAKAGKGASGLKPSTGY